MPVRKAKLFRNGRSQAVRIPKEFELPGTEVRIHREGQRLVLEPERPDDGPSDLLEWLAQKRPIDEPFPEIEDPQPEPVDF